MLIKIRFKKTPYAKTEVILTDDSYTERHSRFIDTDEDNIFDL